MGTGAKQTGCEERLTETGCGAFHPFGGGAPLSRLVVPETFPRNSLQRLSRAAIVGRMGIRPATTITAAELDELYAGQLVHTVAGCDPGQTLKASVSQAVIHRGRAYAHRTITDRNGDTVDRQWFRIE